MMQISRATVRSAVIATGLSVAVSVLIVLMLVPLLGGHPDGPGFWMSILCPIVIAGPASTWQFHQKDIIRRQRDELARMHVELEDAHIALRHMHSELRAKARRDALTGGLNREAVFDALNERAGHISGSATLMVLDADHFKKINDEFGHQVGDEALCRLAEILTQALDGKGFWGRIGGEEFLLFVPEQASDALKTARQILEAAALSDIRSRGMRVPLSVSIGGASVEGAFDPSMLFRRADGNLYRAKGNGRNQIVLDGEVIRPTAA